MCAASAPLIISEQNRTRMRKTQRAAERIPSISSLPLFNNQRFQNAAIHMEIAQHANYPFARQTTKGLIQSAQFKLHSSRTMTGRCRSWTRTRRDENMPILFKTQVKRTAKTQLPRCRSCVSDLCGFRSPTERVPAKHQKTGRCASVRERCESGKHGRRSPAGGFRRRKKPQAARQEKGLTLFCVRPSTSARSAGSFEG